MVRCAGHKQTGDARATVLKALRVCVCGFVRVGGCARDTRVCDDVCVCVVCLGIEGLRIDAILSWVGLLETCADHEQNGDTRGAVLRALREVAANV